MDQLYLVLSVEAGPEVLPLSMLEARGARGGRYVVVAAAGDLPDARVAARRQELTADAVADDDPVWMPRIHQSSHPGFGRSLGAAEGERLVVCLARGHSHPDAALRCLSLLAEWRICAISGTGTTRAASGERRDPVPFPVWDGLLAMEQLDLRPCRPVRGTVHGVEGRVCRWASWHPCSCTRRMLQGSSEGRAHSPGCRHQGRDRGLSRYYELVPVKQMLGAERFDPCSKCGGYATRRLSTTQVAYYRAAHQVHDLAQQVRWFLGHLDRGTDTASLLAELKDWDAATSPEDWFDADDEERQWSRSIRGLLRELEAVVADPQPWS
ncbi:hypothetical protein AB0L85_31050 [Streptomyces sp. NPDC052051]|uniref:hypothetical protein n=1 Tax=Streptomyces sp. NPDC052051 TaxID=3154649 RepID=UPI0034132C0F